MNLNRTALAALLLFLLPAFPARIREHPFWAADRRENFRILLPGGWTVRRHLSQELALRARSRDGTAYLEVHVLREPFRRKLKPQTASGTGMIFSPSLPSSSGEGELFQSAERKGL